jgi:hypothetical protein
VLLVFYIAFVSQRFHAVCLQPVIEKEIGATAHVNLMSLILGLRFCFCVPSSFTHSAAFASTSIHSRFCSPLRLGARCTAHHATRHLFSYQHHLPPPVQALPSIKLQWSAHSRRPCA